MPRVPRVPLFRAALAACLLGAGLGAIARCHVIAVAFGCCGASDHCFHGGAVALAVLYLAAMTSVGLFVDAPAHRLRGYGVVHFATLGALALSPEIQVGKIVDPRGIWSVSLVLSGIALLGAGFTLRR